MPFLGDTEAQAACEIITGFCCFRDAGRARGGAVEGVVFALLFAWADVAHVLVIRSRKGR
jgi:hypothetical protein